MKKNYLLLFVAAALSLYSCGDVLETTPVVNTTLEEEPQQQAIVFGSLSKGTTRAEFGGAEAADLLNYQFVVSGYKGETTADVGAIVFDNYAVKYTENSANSTESNTCNWEYVGVDRIKHAIDRGITRQAAKYWDMTKPQYDFIAWSTGKKQPVYEGAPNDGQVLVSAITPQAASAPATGLGDAYTFSGKAKDLTGCYIADLVTVKKEQYSTEPVTIHFRSLGSKVRIGIYETVPGYSVKDVKFYNAAAVALADEDDPNDGEANKAVNATPKLFTTTEGNIYTGGKYTIYFPTVDAPNDADNNQAHIRFTPEGEQSTVVEFGPLNYTIAEDGEKSDGAVFLGRTSTTASMAGEAEGKYYTQYLPNEAGTNLNLRVNYTLESIDGSGEVIVVKGATAQVPSIYTQWKAGFAYTYLFKISDRTNGYTGDYDPTHPDDTDINSDPAGLYPITFDAMVVNDEDDDQSQETITSVTTPSITTYQEGSNVLNDNEYLASRGDIFVVVSDGETESTPDLEHGKLQTLTDKVELYTIDNGKTEAEVNDALQMQQASDVESVTGRNGLYMHKADFTLTNKIEYGVDGNTINVETDQAMRFTPSAGTYAFVYTKADPSTFTSMYQPVSKQVGESVSGLYRYTFKDAPTGDVQKGVLYFKNNKTDALTVFLGQNVGNFYLDDTGSEIASGHAKTGVTYYYTTDHGMSYQAAHAVTYAEFASELLYKMVEGVMEAKTETTPKDNTAYYYMDGGSLVYCVIYPQQGDGLKVIDYDHEQVACGAGATAVKGMTYFDRYVQNNGVYYSKVIKVQ